MNIGILGTGSFALSIAFLLEKNDHSFCIIGRDVQQLQQLEKEQRNTKYSVYQFKNKIKTMQISPDFNFSSFDLIFYCLPSSSLFLVENIKTPIVFTNKGFENYFLFEKHRFVCRKPTSFWEIHLFLRKQYYTYEKLEKSCRR